MESGFKHYTNKIPKPLRNKYVLVGVIFLVWMTFFDRNKISSRLKLNRTLQTSQEKLDHSKEVIREADRLEKEGFSNDEALEKTAREKHHFKKKGEDVFVIVKEK